MEVGVVGMRKEKKVCGKEILKKVEMKEVEEGMGKDKEKFGLVGGEG